MAQDTISERFIRIKENAYNACIHAGRAEKDVNLVVVTKGQAFEKIIEVVNAGASILGENYPEETVEKIIQLNGIVKPQWHMIGHLQSRKIKYLLPHFSMMHSIDSFEIAQKINQACRTSNQKIDALIEVNLAGEESKNGFLVTTADEKKIFLEDVGEFFGLKNINFVGLMTMPPYAETKDQNKGCYNSCRELLNLINEKYQMTKFSQLSMGTSADFEAAIECGATYIRVGEAIMGKRIYKQ